MHRKFFLFLFLTAILYGCKKDGPNGSTSIDIPKGTIKADWGDTITINGSNLIRSNLSQKEAMNETNVYFGEIGAKIISVSESKIRCEIPTFSHAITTNVIINANGKTVTLPNYVTLNSPTINNYTTKGAIGDTIIIIGNHFNFNNLRVLLGEIECDAVEVTRTKLKVTVPGNVKSFINQIQIFSQLQTATAPGTFEVLKPELKMATASAFIDDKITVTGKNFHPSGNFQVLVNGSLMQSNVENKNTITFKLPYEAYPNRIAKIQIQFLDYKTNTAITNVRDNWLMVNKSTPFLTQNIKPFKVGNNVFVIAPQRNSETEGDYVWKFDSANFDWIKLDRVDIITGTFEVAHTDSKIWLYNPTGSSNFFEYDPNTRVWTKRNQFPGIPRFKASMFSLNGKVYLGSGFNYVDNQRQATDDWYRYSVSDNKWTKISDLHRSNPESDPIESGRSFAIGNVTYLVSTGWAYCFKYDGLSDKWTDISDMPDVRNNAGVIYYKNSGYLIKGGEGFGNEYRDVYKYDPRNNTWSYVDIKINPSSTEPGAAFILNNRIFFVGNALYEGISLP